MNNRNLQKENLDAIGRNLLKSTRINKEEMENLLANPRLFNSVKARIRAEEKSPQTKRFFSEWSNAAFLNYRKAIPAFAILTILIAFAAAMILKKQENPQIAEQKTATEVLSEQSPQAEFSLPITKIENQKSAKNKQPTHAEKIAFKTEKPKSVEPKKKRTVVNQSVSVKKESPEVFYSLQLGENWEKSGEDLQIVRTEISRSELFALGMNVAVENETAKIKTDLLVGSDGIARAIRFVE